MKFNIPKKWIADRIEEDNLLNQNNLQMTSQKKVIILSAISLSGKTTYTNRLIKEKDYYVIHPDNLRKKVTGDEGDISKDSYIWSQLVPAEFVIALINENKDIIFDATQLNKKTRAQTIKTIRDIDKNIKIECHYIEPNLELSKERNKVRERKLPEYVLDSQFAKWQIPTLEEGFTKIVKIN